MIALNRGAGRRMTATITCLVAFAALSACGSDDDGAADTTATNTEPTNTEPTDTQPVETEPVDTEPMDTEPVDTEPVDTEPADTEPVDTEPATTDSVAANTASAEFCDAFIGVDVAFGAAPPPDDPAVLQEYIETEIAPRIETVRANLPTEVADEVTIMVDAVDAVATNGDFSAFETPEFGEATAVVYPYLGEACDVTSVDVAAVDFAFGGMPDELAAGPAVVTMANESETGEAHEILFARVNDGVDLSVEELLALPEDELQGQLQISSGTFAMAGATSGAVVPLTPGRWVYVCLIPEGSVDGTEGTGPPHAALGMAGELTVT